MSSGGSHLVFLLDTLNIFFLHIQLGLPSGFSDRHNFLRGPSNDRIKLKNDKYTFSSQELTETKLTISFHRMVLLKCLYFIASI
jgi:hypothetical protein